MVQREQPVPQVPQVGLAPRVELVPQEPPEEPVQLVQPAQQVLPVRLVPEVVPYSFFPQRTLFIHILSMG
jgi:hypothetical protein